MRRAAPRTVTAAVLLVVVAAGYGSLHADHAAFEPQPYVTGLAFLTNMAFAPDGRLFFTEKDTGRVRVVSPDGVLLTKPFASFGVQGGGETGLLGSRSTLASTAANPASTCT